MNLQIFILGIYYYTCKSHKCLASTALCMSSGDLGILEDRAIYKASFFCIGHTVSWIQHMVPHMAIEIKYKNLGYT